MTWRQSWGHWVFSTQPPIRRFESTVHTTLAHEPRCAGRPGGLCSGRRAGIGPSEGTRLVRTDRSQPKWGGAVELGTNFNKLQEEGAKRAQQVLAWPDCIGRGRSSTWRAQAPAPFGGDVRLHHCAGGASRRASGLLSWWRLHAPAQSRGDVRRHRRAGGASRQTPELLSWRRQRRRRPRGFAGPRASGAGRLLVSPEPLRCPASFFAFLAAPTARAVSVPVTICHLGSLPTHLL